MNEKEETELSENKEANRDELILDLLYGNHFFKNYYLN